MALQIFGQTYEIDKKVLTDLSKEAFLYLDDDFEVNFRFVSEAQIQTLNKVYRTKNKVTDVLSFKLDDDEPGGDVVICYKEMRREAKSWQMTETAVTGFLLVHGILHLAGFDHTNERERARMEKAEVLILAKKNITLNR